MTYFCFVPSVMLAGCLVLPLSGCRPASSPGNESPGPQKSVQKKSSVDVLAEGVTGKYAVDAGQRAKENIRAATEKQNAKLSEVFEE